MKWKEVIEKRIDHFASKWHKFEARQLREALNTIESLVPPEQFESPPPIQVESDQKRKYDSNILNHEQIFYDSIDEVEAAYPTSVFPEDGESQDAKSAMMARVTCNNIRKTYGRRKHEYYGIEVESEKELWEDVGKELQDAFPLSEETNKLIIKNLSTEYHLIKKP